ncbi:MAG: FAD-dependent oxidoreductase [Balneolaceae bacterium]|nr:MAG: FAD-dependent oxidoreductase [Balneolaceae bacterium]
MNIFNYNSIQVLAETDIIVIGGGSAGCLAALAARENKRHDVVLIERYGFPGGTSTQMLDTFYGFFTPGTLPKKIVSGLPDRIVNALDETGDIFLRPNTYGAGTGVTYNPERLKRVWDNLIMQSGTRLFLHTILVDVEKSSDDETICIVWHKSGFFKIKARRVIDASGDADFCHLGNLPYELAGELEPAQSMTTTFRMAGVNLQRFKDAGGKTLLKLKMAEAVELGTHPLPRKEGSAHEMVQKDCIATVAVKVTDLMALDIHDLTAAEVEGRKQAFIYEKFLREEVPGYEEAKIIGLSHQIGVRETRRVYGEYRLTKEDCLSAKKSPDDVFLCGAPIEDHRKGERGEAETVWAYIPGGDVYGVPYQTLVPKGSRNAWVAGRCFSATHDAHASCRSMAQTMSMGQAAGTAALLSLETDNGSGNLDVQQLRNELSKLGALLEVPDKEADISRNGWKNNQI